MRIVIGTPSQYTPSRLLGTSVPTNLEPGGYFVSLYDDRLVASLYVTKYAMSYVVRNVFVDPALRGKGYGRKVMEATLAHLVPKGLDIVLYVEPSNTPAISLYKSLGFTLAKKGAFKGDKYRLVSKHTV